jgi:chromosome segregation ATPase
MAESMSAVDSALWRIAELGARCGQRSAGVDRRPLWQELERLIAELGGELAAARRQAPGAAPELRRLQQELKAALGERDAERARAAEYAGDAETARRERDRARQKATTEAEAARAASQAWQGRLRAVIAAQAEAAQRLEESTARIASLEAALEAAAAERDAVVAARDASVAEYDQALTLLAARAAGQTEPMSVADIVAPEEAAPVYPAGLVEVEIVPAGAPDRVRPAKAPRSRPRGLVRR